MREVRVSRRQVLKGAGAVGVLSALAAPTAVFADNTTVRWDVVSITNGAINSGGVASAKAKDGSKITVTGSGRFQPGDAENVTGGGTWKTFDAAGNQTDAGTYEVRGLAHWKKAPGTPPPLTDNIGNPAEGSAGLAVLEVAYSNSTHGTLTVSCHLNSTPDSVVEGISAAMGFVDFWQIQLPVAGVDANRTEFHVRSEED